MLVYVDCQRIREVDELLDASATDTGPPDRNSDRDMTEESTVTNAHATISSLSRIWSEQGVHGSINVCSATRPHSLSKPCTERTSAGATGKSTSVTISKGSRS